MQMKDVNRYSELIPPTAAKINKISYNIPAIPAGYAKSLKERKFTIRTPNGQKD